MRRWSPALAALMLAACLIGVRLLLPMPFARMQLAAFDSLQSLSPRVPAQPSPVQVVLVDEESLARLGQWPWPRNVLAHLVSALQELGASAIGFDIVFAEPDRTSPARLIAGAADYDQDLAASVARGRVVLGFGLRPEPGGRAPDIKAGFASIGIDPTASVTRFAGAVTNLPSLEAAADGLGSFTVLPGADQVVRRLPLLQALDDQLVPSLSLETLRVGRQVDTIAVRSRRAFGRVGPVVGYMLQLGDQQIPIDADGAIWLHHAPADPALAIAAWRLLDPRERAGLQHRFAGKLVMIGASATGLVDLRATPLNPFEPGVNINAGAVDQLLQGRFLTRPIWAEPAEWLLALLVAALLGGLLSAASMGAAATLAALVVPAMLLLTWFAFTAGLLLDPTVVLVADGITSLLAGATRYLTAERDAVRLRAAFSHYLAPQLVEQLARDPGQLRLGGEVREMTFLFTDLEGFTAMTQSRGAEAVVDLLNRYLDGLCGIAVAHGGTLDKIVGDALHVMFNAPLDQADHAARAVRCALDMDRFATGFAAAEQAQGTAFGRTRIGVNTGRAVVGNFGGARRFDYTAHGDAINTASRLEAANKTLGTRICVAAETADLVQDAAITFRPAGAVLLRGRAAAVDVFEPVTAAHPAWAWADAYAEAFALLSSGDARGGAAILALSAQYPEDHLLALQVQRLRAGEECLPLAA
jgi:adenylate cyclase